MATKKKAPVPAKRKRAQAAPGAAPMVPPPARAEDEGSPADWRWIVGLLVFAFVITKVWDMRDWKGGSFSFGGFGKPALITAQREGAYAERGEAADQVFGCRALSVDKHGNAFYYYLPSYLKKFSPEGKLLANYKAAKKEDQFDNLWALAHASDDSLWAVERGGDRLIHFSPDLKLLGTLKMPEAGLTGLAIDGAGRFLVIVPTGHVLVVDDKGKAVARIGNEGKHAIKNAAKLALDEQDNLYVLDRGDGTATKPQDPKVWVFDKTGKFVAHWLAKGSPWSEFTCLAYDPQGLVVVSNNGQVSTRGLQVYDKKGKLKGLIQTASDGSSLFNVPALAIGAGGDWAIDATPQGRGCDHLRLPALDPK